MTGVFNLELARLYYYLFQKTEQNFTILYALDGYDEISLTGPAKAFSNKGEDIISPQDFGLHRLEATEIIGGSEVASSAAIFMNVLENRCTEAQHNVVCANAAMAIANVKNISPVEGFEKAKDSLASGSALAAYKA